MVIYEYTSMSVCRNSFEHSVNRKCFISVNVLRSVFYETREVSSFWMSVIYEFPCRILYPGEDLDYTVE